MPCCDTGRNIQKYKGAAASTLQDVTDNGNTTTGDIITTTGYFIGDGSKLTGISGASAAFTLQETSDRGNTTSNVIQFTNTITSLTTSGNVIVAGNVTASTFYGDGTTLTGVALSVDLTNNVTRISNLESNLADNVTRISILESNLADNVTRIGNLESNLADNVTRIGNLESNLADNVTRISILESNLADNVTRIGNLESNLTDNVTRISILESNLADNVTRIDNLEDETQPVNRGGTNITTYAKGDILIASDTDTLSNLGLGTSGYVLTSNSTTGLPEWRSASSIGATVAVLNTGNYITGGPFNGSSTATFDVEGTTTNTPSNLVARDSSGDIFVSNVNAINIRGDGSGITNSNASNISTGTLSVTRGGTGVNSSTGSGSVVLNTNPTLSGTVTADTFSGSGSSLTSLNASNISTGNLPVDRGGTGATTLNNLIQMGTHTTGNYVATITGGNGISSTGATSGESIAHTLSVNRKANGGLVIENNQLAVDLSASAITGTLAVSDGGTNITTYTKGDILIASATNTLSKLSLGQGGYVLTSNASTTLPEWRSASDIGTTIATLNTGNYLTGGPYNGSSVATFNVEGTTTNTPSNLVARDSSGDIYVQRVIVGTGSTGTLSSSAWSGSAAKISVSDSTSSSQLPLPFMSAATGDVTLYSDSGALQYQASTGTLSSTHFSGSGTSLTGLNATNINSGTLSNAYGGTGFTSYAIGDLLVGTNTNNLKKLPKGNSNDVLTVKNDGSDIEWAPASSGGSSLWTQSGNDIYYDSGNVSISNSTTNHTVHLGSNVIVNDTGNYDVFRVNGNVFSTGYLLGDGSKILNLKTIKTEADTDVIITSDGGPVSYTNRFYR